MADVAGWAGVSVMTVSRVLNGFPGVADGTRRRVGTPLPRSATTQHPARVLAGGRSRTLGVIAVETEQFGPSHILFGIEAAARAAGHLLSFVTLSRTGKEMASTLEHLRASHVEGIIVVAPVTPVIEALGKIEETMALVVVGGDPRRSAATVTIDQVEGARLATGHLLGLGHRTVHHVPGRGAGSTRRRECKGGRTPSAALAPRAPPHWWVTGAPTAAMRPVCVSDRTRR